MHSIFPFHFWARSAIQASPQCCLSAAFAAAVVACKAAANEDSHVVILTRHRAQCIVNFQAIQFVLPHFTIRGKLEVATSLGFQGRTATHVVLCLPLDKTYWNSFHLEPKALFNILGRSSKTVYLFRHTGDLDARHRLPGRCEIATLLQWYEPGLSATNQQLGIS